MITLRCPTNRETFRVENVEPGEKVACPVCGGSHNIPSRPTPTPDKVAETAELCTQLEFQPFRLSCSSGKRDCGVFAIPDRTRDGAYHDAISVLSKDHEVPTWLWGREDGSDLLATKRKVATATGWTVEQTSKFFFSFLTNRFLKKGEKIHKIAGAGDLGMWCADPELLENKARRSAGRAFFSLGPDVDFFGSTQPDSSTRHLAVIMDKSTLLLEFMPDQLQSHVSSDGSLPCPPSPGWNFSLTAKISLGSRGPVRYHLTQVAEFRHSAALKTESVGFELGLRILAQFDTDGVRKTVESFADSDSESQAEMAERVLNDFYGES